MKLRIPYEFELHAHQKMFRSWKPEKNGTLTKAIVTGYGGGKTWMFARELVRLALVNNGLPVLGVEPTYPMIRDILVPEIEDYLTFLGISYSYFTSDKNFLLHGIPSLKDGNGGSIRLNGRIWLRSGDEPRRLKGPNIAAAGIDEPFIQDEEVYKQVTARVRHPKARERVILLSGTPEGLGWGWSILEDKTTLESETVEIVRGQSIPVRVYTGDRIKWVQCSSEINTALSDDYFENLRTTHTEYEIGSYIGGVFQNLTQGRCYYAYTSANDAPYEIDPNLPVIVTCDFNASVMPMTWLVMQEFGGTIYVRHALSRQHTNTLDMCAILQETFGERMPDKLVFYGDYSGTAASTQSVLSDWGQIDEYWRPRVRRFERYIKPTRSIRDRIAAVNALLCNAKGERRLFLYPGQDTEALRKDLEQVAWDKSGTKENAGDPMRTHAGAALGYFAEYEYPVSIRPRIRHS